METNQIKNTKQLQVIANKYCWDCYRWEINPNDKKVKCEIYKSVLTHLLDRKVYPHDCICIDDNGTPTCLEFEERAWDDMR